MISTSPPSTGKGAPYGCLVLFAVLAVYKVRASLKEGRFWAEEGSIFFPQISQLSGWDAVTYVFNGHLELVTNLLVLAATKVAFVHAPLVTMYGSLGLQLLAMALVFLKRQELGLANWALYALALVMVGLPQAPEVWANSINAHFHMSLVAAVVLASARGALLWQWGSRALLATAGLSGIPPNFLAPVALLKALRSRQKEDWIRAAILCVTAALQLAILSQHSTSTEHRELTTQPAIFWLAILSQQVISPLTIFGDHARLLVDQIKPALQGTLAPVLIALSLTAPAALGMAWVLRQKENSAIKTLLACSVVLALMSISVSLGNKQDLISTAGHGRYFYASNVLLAICLLNASSRTPRAPLLYVLLALLLLASLHKLRARAPGPAWTDSLKAAASTGVVAIHPHGWYMRMPLAPSRTQD